MASSRNLMVAVDGSDNSKTCFHWVLDNIYREGDILVCVHAQEIPTLPAAPYPYGFAYYEEWKQMLEKVIKKPSIFLKNMAECANHYIYLYSDKGPTSETSVKCKLIKEAGEPGPIVEKNVSEECCSSVYVGSRGMGALKRAIIGSTSDYLVHHLHVPIVVIPHPHQ